MKQEINSFLYSCEKDIHDLCIYLYNNPEVSYKEHNSSEYICNLLSKYNFNIQKNFLDINNAFFAQKGDKYPKICYLCEYDAIENVGHITGHNLTATISASAALALGHIINKIGGSVILIGCPGEYFGGSKGTMVKQDTFEDIDVVMEVHPDIITCESGSSSSIIPIGIKFIGTKNLHFLNRSAFTPLDAALLTINILNSTKKGLPEGLEINYVTSNGGNTPLFIPSETELKCYIRARTSKLASYGNEHIKQIVKYVAELTGIENNFFLYEQPNKELITNHTLNRLFSHNLKESGIININPPKNIYAGLSIGDVSHKVPTIHPYISIVEDDTIQYGSIDFAKATISDYALNQCIISAKALACTGIDLIKNENLLLEVKQEFFSQSN